MEEPPFKITAWPLLSLYSDQSSKILDFLWPLFHYTKTVAYKRFHLRPYIVHYSHRIKVEWTIQILLFLIFLSWNEGTWKIILFFGFFFFSGRLENYYYHLLPIFVGWRRSDCIVHLSLFYIYVKNRSFYLRSCLYLFHNYSTRLEYVVICLPFIYRKKEANESITQEFSLLWLVFRVSIKKMGNIFSMIYLHILWPFFMIGYGNGFRFRLFPIISIKYSKEIKSFKCFFHLLGFRCIQSEKGDITNTIWVLPLLWIKWNNHQREIIIYMLGTVIRSNRDYMYILVPPFFLIYRNHLKPGECITMFLPFYFHFTSDGNMTKWILGFYSRYSTHVTRGFMLLFIFIDYDKTADNEYKGAGNINYSIILPCLFMFIRKNKKKSIYKIISPFFHYEENSKYIQRSFLVGLIRWKKYFNPTKYRINIITLYIRYQKGISVYVFGNPIPILPWIRFKWMNDYFQFEIIALFNYTDTGAFKTLYIFPILYLRIIRTEILLMSPFFYYKQNLSSKTILCPLFIYLKRAQQCHTLISWLFIIYRTQQDLLILSLVFQYIHNAQEMRILFLSFYYQQSRYTRSFYAIFILSIWKNKNGISTSVGFNVVPIPFYKSILGAKWKYEKDYPPFYRKKISFHFWPLFTCSRIDISRKYGCKVRNHPLLKEFTIFYILKRFGMICYVMNYFTKIQKFQFVPFIYIMRENSWKNMIFGNLNYTFEISILFFVNPCLSLLRYKEKYNYIMHKVDYHAHVMFLLKGKYVVEYNKEFNAKRNMGYKIDLPKRTQISIAFAWVLRSALSLLFINLSTEVKYDVSVWNCSVYCALLFHCTLNFRDRALNFIESAFLWAFHEKCAMITLRIVKRLNPSITGCIRPLFAFYISKNRKNFFFICLNCEGISLCTIKYTPLEFMKFYSKCLFIYRFAVKRNETELRILSLHRKIYYFIFLHNRSSILIHARFLFKLTKQDDNFNISALYLFSNYHNTCLLKARYGRRVQHIPGDEPQLKISILFLFNFTYRKDQLIRLTLFWILYHHISIFRYSKYQNPKAIKIGLFPIFRFDRLSGVSAKWCLVPLIPVKYTFLYNVCAYEKIVYAKGNNDNGVEDKSTRDETRLLRCLYRVIYILKTPTRRQVEINPIIYFEKTENYAILNLLGGFFGYEKNFIRKKTRRRACCLFYV